MDVRSRVLSAIRWNAAAKIASQLLNWAITIFVIRLLAPEDYGLMAMTMVFVTLVSGLADVGLGAAVVQARTLTGEQLRRVQGAVVLASLLAFAIVQLAAPAIAVFFNEPRLTTLVRVIAFDLLIGAPAVLSYAQLLRDLRMRATAAVEFSVGILASVVTLLLAWKGFGVWSLIVAALVRTAFASAALLVLAPVRPWPRFRFGEIGSLVRFGGVSTVNQLLQRLNAQLDTMIAGRLLEPAQVGAYSVAMHLASMPAAKLSSVLGDIVFPAFSRLQSDLPLMRETLLRALGILAFVAFPTFFGLSSIAPEAVHVLLGARWSEAVLPLVLLPLVLPFRLINGILLAVTSSMGFPGLATRYQIAFLMLLGGAVAVGAHWGLVGIAVAWMVALPLIIATSLPRTLALLDLRAGALLRCLAPSFLASVGMLALIHLARYALLGGAPGDVSALVGGIALGVSSYLAISMVVNRHGVREALLFARRLAGREG